MKSIILLVSLYFQASYGALPIDVLPIAGLRIPNSAGWSEYKQISAIPDQPFEKVWVNSKSKSIRMISTVFSKPSKVCQNEKARLHNLNFLIIDLKRKPAGFACAFSAALGKNFQLVAVKNTERRLNKKELFLSQAIFFEKSSNIDDFKNWISSAQEIRNK